LILIARIEKASKVDKKRKQRDEQFLSPWSKGVSF